MGIPVLVPLTLVTAAYGPLAFLAGPAGATVGAVLWGLGMGVHGSIVPAAVPPMVPPDRRASAYGLFTAAYGVAWFVGSAAMGRLCEISPPLLVGFAVLAEVAAVPRLLRVPRPDRASSMERRGPEGGRDAIEGARERVSVLARGRGDPGVGFGTSSRIRTARILRLSEDPPLVIEVVDAPARMGSLISLPAGAGFLLAR